MSVPSDIPEAVADTALTVVARLPRRLESVGTARELVGRLVDPRVDDDGLADARLLVSEVVTNSVLHGAGERVTLAVEVRDDLLRVEVVDAGPGIPDDRGAELPPAESITGRGLGILARTAHRWGHRAGPSRVWFELFCRGGADAGP